MGTAKIRCAKCGSDDFIKPDDPKPDDHITCSGCGEITRWADVESEVVKAAEKALKDQLAKAGFKF